MYKLNTITVLLLFNLIWLSPVIYSQDAEELYQQGVQYEEIKGDLDKAISVYENVILSAASAGKTASLAHLHLGMCYEKLGGKNIDKAISHYQLVVQKFPEQKEAVRIATEKLAKYDTREKDIEEIMETIEYYYNALRSKNGARVVSFFSKNYYDNTIWGKLKDKTPDEEFIDWLNETYFTPWESITWSFKIKKIEKDGFNYVVFHDFEVIVSDKNNPNITLTKASDFPFIMSKENGKWKINTKKADTSHDSPLPNTYKTIGKTKTEPGTPGMIYISHISENFVTVIEPSQRQITDQLFSHYGSTSIEFSPDGKKGFITNYFSNEITIFNTKNDKGITNITVGEHPTNMFISPDGKKLVVMHQSNAAMWVLDAETYKVIKKYPETTGIIKMNPVNNKIYCSAIFSPFVYVLNQDDLSIEKSIFTGGRPMELEFSADGKFLYIPNYDFNEVEKIDCSLDSVIAKIPDVTDARGIAVSRDNKYAFVTNVISNSLTVIDLAKDMVIKRIPVGNMPTSAAVSADNNYVYVTNQGAGTLSVIDINKLVLAETIEVAPNPITVQVH